MLKRGLQIVLLVVASVTMLGAGSPTARFDKIGHSLMCTCGCAEILLECNHVGCPDSPGLINDLQAQLASGSTNKAIFEHFAATYGPIVLAAPIRGGFDNVAWIMPFAVLLLGGLGIVVLLRIWKRRHAGAVAMGPEAYPAEQDDALQQADQALRERIRQETRYGE